MQPDLRSIPLGSLVLSTTTAQQERRAHFDKGALNELAESIKSVGLLQPIVVRPLNGDGTYQVVAGERRVAAAQLAGLEEISANVRELTDEQVLEVQLIENLRREDLHELAQAEGFEQLIKLGWSADQIAEKVGTSKATVYARMKLIALTPESRKAFYASKLTASHALLLARIPSDLQKEALQIFLKGRFGNGEPLSYREAQRYVHDTYMLQLARAEFPTGDAELVPMAGPCTTCPKRTGNQPELFGDVKSADVCTDPTCFKQKRRANAERILAQAEASGQEVISGAAAKKIAPNGADYSLHGYKKLDEKCYDDPKYRTAAQILGKRYEPKLLQDPESGKIIRVAREGDIAQALKAQGVRPSRGGDPSQSAREKKAKTERAFRQALYSEIRQKLPTELKRTQLEAIAIEFFKRHQHETQKQLLKVWGVEPEKAKHHSGVNTEDAGAHHLAKAGDEELARYLQDMVYALDLQVSTWFDGKPERLLAAAKRLRIDAEKIRRESAPAAKKVAKKKAARA